MKDLIFTVTFADFFSLNERISKQTSTELLTTTSAAWFLSPFPHQGDYLGLFGWLGLLIWKTLIQEIFLIPDSLLRCPRGHTAPLHLAGAGREGVQAGVWIVIRSGAITVKKLTSTYSGHKQQLQWILKTTIGWTILKFMGLFFFYTGSKLYLHIKINTLSPSNISWNDPLQVAARHKTCILK